MNQCGIRFRVRDSVTVWTYSWRTTRTQSYSPEWFGPSRGVSIAITGPVAAAIVWMFGMPVIRTANQLWFGISSSVVFCAGSWSIAVATTEWISARIGSISRASTSSGPGL